MEESIVLVSLVSGLFAALVTLIGQFLLALKKENDETKALIKALKSEINNIEYIFSNEFGEKITQDEKPLLYSYPTDTDYFYIYHSNCSKIGKIKNDKLRNTIISIYTMAKFFIDCLKSNNAAIVYYEEIERKYTSCTIPKDENPKYKEDSAVAMDCLYNSKVNNLLPTYQKLSSLFFELKNIK